MSRTVTLALVKPDGEPLGTTRPFDVETQWWQEVAPVVQGARRELGIDVVVLRLVAAEKAAPHGGGVTYLAEYDGPPLELGPFERSWLTPHPLRMTWAQPGGPAASLRWAGVKTGVQQRTWNLSSVWKLNGAWLKEAPPFLRHEAIVLEWLGKRLPDLVPGVLKADGSRMLLADVPGTDRYDAEPAEVVEMVADLFEIQSLAAGHVDELLALGVPDWRGNPFTERASATADAYADQLTADERQRLAKLVGGLPERFAELADCGIPDSLVHGDFHPGNVRSDGVRRVILDWPDSVIGHPALDVRDVPELQERWISLWRKEIPGCEPERALELKRPLGALRGAAIYDTFLAGIEPSERPYHAADPLNCLRAAVS
ncbi:aminoglycoside phosphotransferase family protein [Kutzneria sp. CA-103260]|uniref:aminoglycoside phosphotransferase family protein n=1 Tax=Kutzneria sp. CA-103260 TaxID=2802641 RepID=UPI001BA75FD1|nr:aminoglycoside phosphotransferase family protein [Kutzneria sp. CA-103260]QUQ72153.1 aminoglycoside phosphotransferase family protein [Kutzneria sp. CA-103260]